MTSTIFPQFTITTTLAAGYQCVSASHENKPRNVVHHPILEAVADIVTLFAGPMNEECAFRRYVCAWVDVGRLLRFKSGCYAGGDHGRS